MACAVGRVVVPAGGCISWNLGSGSPTGIASTRCVMNAPRRIGLEVVSWAKVLRNATRVRNPGRLVASSVIFVGVVAVEVTP